MYGKLGSAGRTTTKKLLLVLVLLFICTACSAGESAKTGQQEETNSARLFIVGQDLGAIREYYESDCCVTPDGKTTYLSLYNLLSEQFNYSGLGMDASGNSLDREPDTGTGPQNAWKTAMEFDGGLAIGLELVENDHPQALSHLLEGRFDPHIQQLASFIKKIDQTVWLRVGYEFDGVWNQGYSDAEKYKAAYRYVVDKLREQNVKNVEYVWQTSASPIDDLIDRGRDDISKWYPGDFYVDWMAVSWFLAPDARPAVEPDYEVPTQRQLTDELLAFARLKNKPVMIAEASPQAYDLANTTKANITPIWDGPSKGDLKQLTGSEIWQAWYAPLVQYMGDNDDVIRALAYINVNWDAQARWGAPHNEGYWGDSRLQANPEIAKRFNQAIYDWRDR